MDTTLTELVRVTRRSAESELQLSLLAALTPRPNLVICTRRRGRLWQGVVQTRVGSQVWFTKWLPVESAAAAAAEEWCARGRK